MVDSILTVLQRSGVLSQLVLTNEIRAFLGSFEIQTIEDDNASGVRKGTADLKPKYNKNLLGGFGLNLTAPPLLTGMVFRLKVLKAPPTLKLWVALPQNDTVDDLFSIAGDIANFALTPAKLEPAEGNDGRQKLVKEAGDLNLVIKGSQGNAEEVLPCLTVSATAARAAHMGFAPSMVDDQPDGVIHFGFNSNAVMFGETGVGFTFDKSDGGKFDGFYLDDSKEASALSVWPQGVNLPDDIRSPTWRGFAAPKVIFYLPPNIPIFGGRPIHGHFAIGIEGSRSDVVIEANSPQQGDDPGFKIRIECRDKSTNGLAGLVPTNITSTVEFPINKKTASVTPKDDTPKTIEFSSNKPVMLTLNLSRDPLNAEKEFVTKLSIAFAGDNGVFSVNASGDPGITAAKLFITAAAMATAIIADKNVERKTRTDGFKGSALYALLAAAAPASSLLADKAGKFTLKGAEFETSGNEAPVGGAMVLKLDYVVSVVVTEFAVAGVGVSMIPDQPMRIRVKDLRMSFDPGKSGLEKFGLDFEQSKMEIVDPGHWKLGGLDSLFDILDTRSGQGSSWMEIDLGFKLDLGPIHVSKTTIRIVLDSDGHISATIRGLKAGIEVPKLIEGTGDVQVFDGGFAADFAAKLMPLNIGAKGSFIKRSDMIFVGLGVDLPAPIPLANSGFGLFGIGGNFGNNARPKFDQSIEDQVKCQLAWKPETSGFERAPGSNTFGLEGVIGTLPDMGFSFSAKAGLQITAPDISVRAALSGRVLQPAFKISDQVQLDGEGLSFLGMLSVDSKALTIGILGAFNLKPILEARVPLGAYFPFGSESNKWYIYLGADGAQEQGRSIGPITVRILPRYLNMGADAYVMMNGDGFVAWPNRIGATKRTVEGGFAVALGFSVQQSFGYKPLVWAELYASLDLLLATKPLLLAGFGRAGGGLHLGPFSLSVTAQMSFAFSNDVEFIWLEVTGKIELFFFDIEGTVTISFGQENPPTAVPQPDKHPLDQVDERGNVIGTLGALTDDTYRVIARLVEKIEQLVPENDVWADCLISIPFALPPEIGPSADSQFPGVRAPNKPKQAGVTGSEMLRYVWTLDDFKLFDVTDAPDPAVGGTVPPGKFAARWQQPRGSSGTVDISELVLFTTESALWINRVADAGEGAKDDPLSKIANLCQLPPLSAEDGWSVGALSELRSDGYFLPTNPLNLSPYASLIDAKLNVSFDIGIGVVGFNQNHVLKPPMKYVPATLFVWEKPIELLPRHFPELPEFRGFLELETIGGLLHPMMMRLQQEQTATLETAEKIYSGKLILLIRMTPEIQSGQLSDRVITVLDSSNNKWSKVHQEIIDTQNGRAVLLVFKAPAGAFSNKVTISWPLGIALGVVGYGGVTQSALAVVKAENDANAEEAKQRAKAAQKGPTTTITSADPNQRSILVPGHTYRIDIKMSWKGTLKKRNADGTELPPIVGGDSKNRSLFFRIAKKADPEPDLPNRLVHLFRTSSSFRPEMLQRYLGGYEPQQAQEHFFCDDPLKVHFKQNHVVALAKAYGHDLELSVRRTDKGIKDPTILVLDWSFIEVPEFLNSYDQRRFDLAISSPCEQPRPGVTGKALTPLDPFAPYELYVHAKAEVGTDDGRLDGVTFKTSRYRSPLDMCTNIGLSVAGRPEPKAVLFGDLEISRSVSLTPVQAPSDLAFQKALQDIGIADWQPTDEVRFSRFWTVTAEGQWQFNGMMIELLEPLNRAGRLEVKGLVLEMGATGESFKLQQMNTDRTGARLLFLADAPVTLAAHNPFVIIRPTDPIDQPLNRPGIRWRKTPFKRKGSNPNGGGLLVPTWIPPKCVLEIFDHLKGEKILASKELPIVPDFVEDRL